LYCRSSKTHFVLSHVSFIFPLRCTVKLIYNANVLKKLNKILYYVSLCLSPKEVWPVFGSWSPLAFLWVLRQSFMRYGCQTYTHPPEILEDQWIASLVAHHKSVQCRRPSSYDTASVAWWIMEAHKLCHHSLKSAGICVLSTCCDFA
jgi:hypothetical protein